MNREVKDMIRECLKIEGCEVEADGRSHFRVTLNGRKIGTIPNSPSDHRTMKNTRALLRRNGLVI